MALTLIRACRIKLAVSEEKLNQIPEEEIQCPGKHTYEYALCFFDDNFYELTNSAADYFTKAPCAVSGRGKGELPHRKSLLEIDNKNIHVTAIKRAENKNGTVIRLFNPTDKEQMINMKTELGEKIYKCRMDETILEKINCNFVVESKKIVTLLIEK